MQKELELKDVVFSKLNARKSFDAVKMEELTDSIRRKGVLQPVIVRASGKGWEVVCGERRVRASREAGLKFIPAIIKKLSDEGVVEIQVIENLQREDLNSVDEAKGFWTMLKKFKHTQEDLSSRTGKSATYIGSRLKLLELGEDILQVIRKDIITPGHGLVLLRIGDEKKRKDFLKATIREKWSVRMAENKLQEHCSLRLDKALFDKKDCVKCEYNGSKQKDFFDKATNIKGNCLNSACFMKKVEGYINSKIDKLNKDGHKVVSKKQFEKLSVNKLAEEIEEGSGYNYKERLGKNYTEKCLKCGNHYFVIAKINYGPLEGAPKIEEHCLNAKCMSNLIRGKTTETGSRQTPEYKREQNRKKVREAKRAFWIEKVMTNKSKKEMNAMILDRLIHEAHSTEVQRWTGLKSVGYASISVKKLYELGDAKVQEVITKILTKITGNLQDSDLEFLTGKLKFDVKKDFVINEIYLKAKTKEQITALAKEVGLITFLKTTGLGAYLNKGFGSLKKTVMIDCFLKKGFKLPGRVPKEIKGKK